jgi:proline iminopeptidase
VDAYFRLMHSADPVVRTKAARDFHDWEWALFTAVTNTPQSSRWRDPIFQLARGRIITHYFRHGAWLDEGRLLAQATAWQAFLASWYTDVSMWVAP